MEKLKKSTLLKILALFLSALFTFTLLISSISLFVMLKYDVYGTSKEDTLKNEISNVAWSYAMAIAHECPDMDAEYLEETWKNVNFTFTVELDKDGEKEIIFDNTHGSEKPADAEYSLNVYKEFRYGYSEEDRSAHVSFKYTPGDKADYVTYRVCVFADDISSFTHDDSFSRVVRLINAAYALKRAMPLIVLVSLIFLILTDIYIVCAAGHRKDTNGVRENFFDKLPFDILLAVYAMIGSFEAFILLDTGWESVVLPVIVFCIFAAADSLLLSYLLLTFSTRCKVGRLFKNTVIFMVLNLIWRFVKYLFKLLLRFFRNIVRLMRCIPLVWRTSLGCFAFCVIEFFILAFNIQSDSLVAWWVIEKLIVIPAVIYLAVVLRKLQKGADELSGGNLSYRVNTSVMFGDFKRHGEAMNNLNSGLSIALEEKMKSERLKTELITNVSHDIKTPLTSIINYVGLLKSENLESGAAKEYVDVLDRQSARLKKLTDDLVEASKASTGNISVEKAPVDLSVLLVQLSAEYGERALEKGLELVIKNVNSPLMVMADGKLLQRIIDNLMTNICKYSLENTRVYIDLSSSAGRASLTFKNISRYPLNISSDELTERFVRGDSSRNTEGSGLGLSIAKSLTELQGASLVITTDGDLFKATLIFDEM